MIGEVGKPGQGFDFGDRARLGGETQQKGGRAA